jgi:hypothetical protein
MTLYTSFYIYVTLGINLGRRQKHKKEKSKKLLLECFKHFELEGEE